MTLINSLAPGKFVWNFRHIIFKQILVIDEIALTWKLQDLTDDKSTLVQVMARCRQATSHYLSQCWPSSLSPYGITRPQWVNFVIVAVLVDLHLFVCVSLLHILLYSLSCCTRDTDVNWLAPRRCENNFESVISKHMLWIKFMSISCEITLRRIPQNTFNDKSMLIQVMLSQIYVGIWHHKAIMS